MEREIGMNQEDLLSLSLSLSLPLLFNICVKDVKSKLVFLYRNYINILMTSREEFSDIIKIQIVQTSKNENKTYVDIIRRQCKTNSSFEALGTVQYSLVLSIQEDRKFIPFLLQCELIRQQLENYSYCKISIDVHISWALSMLKGDERLKKNGRFGWLI